MSKRRIMPCLSAVLMCLLFATGCAERSHSARSSAPSLAADPTLHNALPSSIRTSGILRIATDASYPPASSFGPDGHTIIGFEPDLAAALAGILGVRAVFTNNKFTTLADVVDSHETDLVMSAMTDTHEREKKIDFVDYFTAGSTIIVQRGNPKGIADITNLCGHVVALQRGTVEVDLIARTQHNCSGKPIVVHLFDTGTDALVQVRTGSADAVITDYPPAAALVADPRTSPYYQLASTAQYEPGPYGIGIAKDQPQLRDAVAQALQRLMTSGSYGTILHKWGVTAGALSAVSINASQRK